MVMIRNNYSDKAVLSTLNLLLKGKEETVKIRLKKEQVKFLDNGSVEVKIKDWLHNGNSTD